MKSSKNDTFVYRTWVKTLVVYFVMFVMSAVVPITAMFPNLGYPCYFNALVDYGALNLTNYNLAHHLTPTLRMYQKMGRMRKRFTAPSTMSPTIK